ncbi:hypothetical protein CONLIGDRAFT_700646 [Coniochaeta ligniaria NRRL 30616]|uniref:Uncharacterized protein n=1 Tax=Coniochaeta ligniaria NRRL 30616 TaxID=1408157 RepID=A0A1J7IUX2_9PEZI|nr:hypothetical protein CONLIGDRAFT_700646 [Coniochaeta ligniaria NRRL 30616]
MSGVHRGLRLESLDENALNLNVLRGEIEIACLWPSLAGCLFLGEPSVQVNPCLALPEMLHKPRREIAGVSMLGDGAGVAMRAPQVSGAEVVFLPQLVEPGPAGWFVWVGQLLQLADLLYHRGVALWEEGGIFEGGLHGL